MTSSTAWSWEGLRGQPCIELCTRSARAEYTPCIYAIYIHGVYVPYIYMVCMCLIYTPCIYAIYTIHNVNVPYVYMVYTRYCLQGFDQVYGHIRRPYTVLANPSSVWKRRSGYTIEESCWCRVVCRVFEEKGEEAAFVTWIYNARSTEMASVGLPFSATFQHCFEALSSVQWLRVCDAFKKGPKNIKESMGVTW